MCYILKQKQNISKTSYIQQLQFHNLIHNYGYNFNYFYSVNVKLRQLYMDMHNEKFPSNLKKENKKNGARTFQQFFIDMFLCNSILDLNEAKYRCLHCVCKGIFLIYSILWCSCCYNLGRVEGSIYFSKRKKIRV